MCKKLSEMTLEELWQLFPIQLSKPQTYWSNWYEEEIQEIKSILPFHTEYHHIGSTAINGIMAKPIIDILIVFNFKEELNQAAGILEESQYILMSRGEHRISLNKGYTEHGFAERVFHLHLRLKGDADEIYFRDYLNFHPEVAKEYEQLKLKLWKLYEHNRDAYTKAKTDFVKKYTEIAKTKNR